MAQEVELERMVVRLVGDTMQYVKTLDQAYTQTKVTADKIGGVTFVTNFNVSGGLAGPAKIAKDSVDAQKQVAFLNTNMGDLRKSMVLMSTVGIIDPQAGHMLFVAIQGFGLLKTAIIGAYAALKAMQWSTFRAAIVDAFVAARIAITGMVTALFTAQGALTALKVALISTGIGAVLVAVGSLVAWLTKLSHEFTAAKEAAGQAFQSMVTGARSAQQAIADVRLNSLTEGAKELQDVINPGFWRSIWNGLQNVVGLDAVQRKFDDIVARARQAEDLFRRLQDDPRMQSLQREIANRRNAQSSRDVATSLEEEAARAGMAANEAKRYAEAQKYAREASISLEAALSRLAASHARQRTAEMAIEVGKLTIQLRDLNDEADRSGLTEISNRLTAIVQQFWRANPAVGSFADALRRLQPILEGTRQALVRQQFGEFGRTLRDQIISMGLSSERAQLLRMRVEGLGDEQYQAGLQTVRHVEALRALQQQIEAVNGTRAGSVEAQFRIDEYRRVFDVIQRTNNARQQALMEQNRSVASPQAPAARAGGTEALGRAETAEQRRQRLLAGNPETPDQRARRENDERLGLPPGTSGPLHPAYQPQPSSPTPLASTPVPGGSRPTTTVSSDIPVPSSQSTSGSGGERLLPVMNEIKNILNSQLVLLRIANPTSYTTQRALGLN